MSVAGRTHRPTLKTVTAAALLLGCASCAAPAAPATDVAASGTVLSGSTTTGQRATDLPAAKRPYKGPGSAPFSRPDSPRRILYGPSLASDPLPARHAPLRVTAAEAVRGTQVLRDAQPGGPRVTLRLLTYGWAGSTPRRSPGWVLTWSDSAPIVRGGIATTEQQRRRLQHTSECVYVVVVDATSGRAPFEGQTCRPKGASPR